MTQLILLLFLKVREFLTDKKFIIVDDQAIADIIFIKDHFKDFK
jgi:hypothetical protein